MSQKFSLYELLTVDQNIQLYSGIYGLGRARREERRRYVIEMAGLQGREKMLARDLPGGFRQRLALGCAIVHEPPILFLDEPTGGVDPAVAAALLAPDRRALALRRDDPRDDALSRRGRVLPSPRGDPRRPPGRDRDHARAEGRLRRSARGRAARPEAGGHRCAPSTRCRRSRRAACSAPRFMRCSGQAGQGAEALSRRLPGSRRRGQLDRDGPAVARGRVPRRGREGWAAHEEGAGGRPQGVPADPAGPAHPDDPAVHPGLLPAALRLRAELRHPARRHSRWRTGTAPRRAARLFRRSSTPDTSTSWRRCTRPTRPGG